MTYTIKFNKFAKVLGNDLLGNPNETNLSPTYKRASDFFSMCTNHAESFHRHE